MSACSRPRPTTVNPCGAGRPTNSRPICPPAPNTKTVLTGSITARNPAAFVVSSTRVVALRASTEIMAGATYHLDFRHFEGRAGEQLVDSNLAVDQALLVGVLRQ